MSNWATVKAGVDRETGTAYFDNLQLEDGNTANRYNLVENSNFENGLDFWPEPNGLTSNDVRTTATGQPTSLGSNVFKITGEAS